MSLLLLFVSPDTADNLECLLIGNDFSTGDLRSRPGFTVPFVCGAADVDEEDDDSNVALTR